MMTQVPLLAYIDPGSGTVLMQIVLSGFVALLIFLRTRALSLVRLPFRAGKNTSVDRPEDPSTGTVEAGDSPCAPAAGDRACRP